MRNLFIAVLLAGSISLSAQPVASDPKPEPVTSGKDVAFSLDDVARNTSTQGHLDPDLILPPAWAFGVLYGFYTDQAGIQKNLHKLIEGDFPVDALWVDSAFWDLSTYGPLGYHDFKSDLKAFPRLSAMTAELSKEHVRFGIWTWERILDANKDTFAEFESKGYFTPEPIVGNGWHNRGSKSVARTVDFSNPGAAALWAEKMRPFLEQGVDFFKIDAKPTHDYLKLHFELSQKYGKHTRGRGFVLSHRFRQTAQDIKRYPGAWTGDADASWNQLDYPDNVKFVLGGLKQQIEMVANPEWNTYPYPFLGNDTGGYHKPKLGRPEMEELFTRWTQFSSFGSLMHVFGKITVPEQNAPFAWSTPVQDNFRTYSHLRLRLFPYLYTHALLTRLKGQKIIQGDAAHRFQFLFGDSFLVAPVYEPGATSRTLWLPEGSDWIDYWTGASYAGGREISLAAPLERLPLLVRAGAIIPLRDYARCVELGSNRKLTLDIYPDKPGRDSQFILLEDDGLSNDYLSGGIASTTLRCLPELGRTRVLISPIQGGYAGMPGHRTWCFQIHLGVRPGKLLVNGEPKSFTYDEASQLLTVSHSAPVSTPLEIELQY